MPSSRVSRPTRAMRFAMVLKRLEPGNGRLFFLSKRSTGTRRRLNTTHKIKQSSIKIGHHCRLRDAIDENETRERTEVRVFIATALPTKAVCWTVVAANIFVYLCVFLLCAWPALITSRLREKNYPKREEEEGRGEANEKKGKKKVDCHPYPKPWCKPSTLITLYVCEKI